jgi:hypothetical protein
MGSLISWGVQTQLLGRRIEADEALAQRNFDFDKEIAERKFRYDRELHDHKRQPVKFRPVRTPHLRREEFQKAIGPAQAGAEIIAGADDATRGRYVIGSALRTAPGDKVFRYLEQPSQSYGRYRRADRIVPNLT